MEQGAALMESMRDQLKAQLDFGRELTSVMSGMKQAVEQSTGASATDAGQRSGSESTAGRSHDQAVHRLLSVLTNGVADERITEAASVLQDDELTTHEKLTKIHAAIGIPCTASAEQLGKMFGVTKQAVMKTGWWNQRRRGERENAIGQRRDKHRERAEEIDQNQQNDDD
jgi:hypothetical protein